MWLYNSVHNYMFCDVQNALFTSVVNSGGYSGLGGNEQTQSGTCVSWTWRIHFYLQKKENYTKNNKPWLI